MKISAAFIWVSGAVAFPLLASVTVLVILDAVSTSIRYLGLTITAAALDVVALGSLTLVITVALRRGLQPKDGRRSRWRAIAIPAICACFGLVAAATTLAELTLNRHHVAASSDRARMTTAIGLCGGAILAQAVFYSAVAIAVSSSVTYRRALAESRSDTPQEMMQPIPQRIVPPPRALVRQDEEKQWALLNLSATSLPTIRSSLSQAVRPITSKTRLVRTPTAEGSHLSLSLRSSIDSLNRADAFDKWDTSDVDSDTRDTVLSGCTRRQGTLEPIPGSRPGSPGRPLEGPFPDTSPVSQGSSPVVVEPTSSPYVSRPGTSHSHHTPYIRRNDSRVSVDSTRPNSPAVSEAHIHPLFRTDSPTPPPAHSPNTVILASPRAGQFILPPPKALSRMNSRENVRGGAHSPLVRSKSFVSDRGPAASSGPPSRAPTPPIPDFVMGGAK